MSNTRKTINVNVSSPAASKKIPIFQAPSDQTWTIEAAYMTYDTTIAASTADYVTATLENGGTVGTGTTDMSDAIGGTPGWVANTKKTFAITAALGDVTPGQVVNLDYVVAGTIAINRALVTLEVVEGQGAKFG